MSHETPAIRPVPHRLTGAIGQTLGIVVFLVGLAALFYVFRTANTLLNEPVPVIAASAQPSPNGDSASALTQVGVDMAGFVRRLLLLLLLSIVGGITASVGTTLFFKARRSY